MTSLPGKHAKHAAFEKNVPRKLAISIVVAVAVVVVVLLAAVPVVPALAQASVAHAPAPKATAENPVAASPASGRLAFQRTSFGWDISRHADSALAENGAWETPFHVADADILDNAASQRSEMANAEQAVRALVGRYGQNVAVSVIPLDGTLGFDVNGDKRFIAASMIKLLVLAEYMDQVDAGTLGPQQTYELSYQDIVGGSGVLQNERMGTAHTYESLVGCMIYYSDNVATNVLVDILGQDEINQKAEELGLKETSLQGKLMCSDAGGDNYICANDAARILSGIATHTLASGEMCDKAEFFLLSQTDEEGLIEGFPSGVSFGHKTGSLDNMRHDGGIVYGDHPFVIVMLTSMDPYSGNSLMKEAAALVYGALHPTASCDSADDSSCA